jgi:hypothetical protein
MAEVHGSIRSFRAIFLPPADIILRGNIARKYLKISKPSGEATTLVNAHAAALVNQDNITRAQAAFEKKSRDVDVASRHSADQWVDNVFGALAGHLPGVQVPANTYQDDILYVVTTPEFGLNGSQDPPDDEDGIKMWDASGAFPESLEVYITEKVGEKMSSDRFIHFHILFVFSCFTHSTQTMVPQVDPGKNSPPKIVANNRLNIVCLKSATPGATNPTHYTVTKFAWNAVDTVREQLFTRERGWNSTTQERLFGDPAKPRNEETKITLPWHDVNNTPVVLGFGTCQDVLVDQHLTEHMVIFCGSGTPFMRVPEVVNLPMTYPFLLNDTKS